MKKTAGFRLSAAVWAFLLTGCGLKTATEETLPSYSGQEETTVPARETTTQAETEKETETIPETTEKETEPEPDYEDWEKVLYSMSIKERIEELLIPSLKTWSENGGEPKNVTELNDGLTACLHNHHFGGVVLFEQNMVSIAQTVSLIADLQKENATGDAKTALLILTDQEGGQQNRVLSGTRMVGSMALGAIGEPQLATQSAYAMGEELAALGISVDLAPVLDLNSNPENPVLGVRSFSEDPMLAAQLGQGYIAGLHEAGIIATVKHFPGHGDPEKDPDTGFPRVNKDLAELKEKELVPFVFTAYDADILMTAHIQFPKIETGKVVSQSTGREMFLPGTMSKALLTDFLRGEMAYQGVVLSDAMDLSDISEHFDPVDAAVLAVNAGVDMLLIPVAVRGPETVEELDRYIEALVQKVEAGEITEKRLNEACGRVIRLKKQYGLMDPLSPTEEEIQEKTEYALSVVGSPEHETLAFELAKKAVTLVSAKPEVLPLVQAEKTIIVVAYEAQKRAIDQILPEIRASGVLEEGAEVSCRYLSDLSKRTVKALAEEADNLVVVSTLYREAELDPEKKAGSILAAYDLMQEIIQEKEGRFIVISAQLPYDTARFPEADAVLAAYLGKGMMDGGAGTYGEHYGYGANINAAVLAVMTGFLPTGKLPVTVYALDEEWHYDTSTVLYPAGTGAEP